MRRSGWLGAASTTSQWPIARVAHDVGQHDVGPDVGERDAGHVEHEASRHPRDQPLEVVAQGGRRQAVEVTLDDHERGLADEVAAPRERERGRSIHQRTTTVHGTPVASGRDRGHPPG